MSEYGFSLARFLLHKDRIYNSAVTRKNTGQGKPYFGVFYTVTWYQKKNERQATNNINCLE